MRPERLRNIIAKVQEKYIGQRLSPLMVHCMYNDISAVIRGLHKKEHFLNVTIDTRKKVILCKDEETLTYLGLLPYLENRLMGDDEVYLVYLLKGICAYSQCAVKFEDLYNCTDESDLGFAVQIHPMIPLGMYYPETDEFRRMEG